ncbi:MAG: hypothetical protein HGB36_11565 [Chlorobiaceae bacterium]|nr:hypothetical protein [Chlorobiaceae bacterium]
MKKLLSLLALFSVMSYAPNASAELKLNGEAGIRLRDDFNDVDTYGVKTSKDDQYFQYRIRLKPSADLGNGYFFKALIQDESYAGGWSTVKDNNTEKYNLAVSQFYFGHNSENSHWQIGRLPLGSFDNPVLDLTLYAIPGTGPQGTKLYAVDTPISTNHFDRLFGFNYGVNIGKGEWNVIVVNFDNQAEFFNDGYGLYTSFKAPLGKVTVVPQAYFTLTHLADGRNPFSFGAQVFIPVEKSKISLSGFYTADNNSYKGNTYDYSGYILRVKAESGPILAWVDYNKTTDDRHNTDYNNTFVWAQYNFKIYESAAGKFNLTPTIRYRASSQKNALGQIDNDLFRTELYATVTF